MAAAAEVSNSTRVEKFVTSNRSNRSASSGSARDLSFGSKETKGKATAKIAADPKNEYVIISGVQIHGALGKNFWWPGSVTMIKDNQETDLSAKFEAALGSYDLASWLKAEVSSRPRTPP